MIVYPSLYCLLYILYTLSLQLRERLSILKVQEKEEEEKKRQEIIQNKVVRYAEYVLISSYLNCLVHDINLMLNWIADFRFPKNQI